MASVSLNSPVFDFSKITSEISQSVSNIKGKTSALKLQLPLEENAPQNNYNNFGLGSFAVSYLEPGASFAVHKFVSENQEGENLRKQAGQERDVRNGEDVKAATSGDETEGTSGVSFLDELYNRITSVSSQQADKAYRQDYSFVAPVSVFGGENANSSRPDKAAQAYDYVFNINAPRKVLIDFMHGYNRNFDFSI